MAGEECDEIWRTMKHCVLNLTVVLTDDTIIKTRHGPRKSSAGYHLNSFFTGSEGMLGIITEATLKLAVLPQDFAVATATFPTVGDAAFAASKLVRSGIPLAALEMMNEIQMKIINHNDGVAGRLYDELLTFFIKFSGTVSAIRESVPLAKQITAENGARRFVEASRDIKEQENLWTTRKEALQVVIKPERAEIWGTGVAIPIFRPAEIIELSKQELSDLGLISSFFVTLEMGNFHQSVLYDP